jgi:RND family efflux transporter MFP subunit
VAEADRDQSKAMFGYARVTAPFDGTVSVRNVNKGHFLLAAAGGNKGEPLFTVVSADTVRVFVDVPEADAGLVRDGTEAKVRVPSLGREVDGTVTRASGVIDPKTRTLRAEIDLPNKDGMLRPGVYVFATLVVKREGVLTLPASAVVTGDSGAYCFRVEGGKAVRTPVQTGLSGGGLVEVLKGVTGGEEVAANAGVLKDGQEVAQARQ